MKKKLLLCVSLIAILVFVLALCVSAESRIVKLDSDPGLDCDDSLVSYLDGDYAPYTPITWASVAGGLDTESRVVLTDGNGGYYVFPTWYIYKDEAYETNRPGNHNGFKHCIKFERLNAAIAKLNSETGTEHFASFTSHKENVVRIEILRGCANIAQSTQKFENCTLLKEVRFPSTMSVIDAQNCFTGATSITTLDLSMTKITYLSNAFASSATGLTTVILPSTVTSIYSSAFSGCSSLTTINTSNVTSMGDNAFKGTAIYEIDTSNVASYGQHVFSNTTNLETFVIKEGVTTIPVNFCQNAKALKTIVIPSSVTSFSGYTFSSCTALETVVIKANITGLPASVFNGCSKLKNVTLPDTIETIGEKVFYYCSALEYIKLPANLRIGGHDMFSGCNSLKTIVVPRTMTQLCANNAQCKYAFHGKGNIIYTGSTDSDFYKNELLNNYSASKITIANHCETYFDGHLAGGEVHKVFLGQAFASEYKIYTECGRECGTENVIEVVDKLIHTKGYSTSEIPGSKAMMHSFVVDKSLVAKYQELFTDLKFGVLAVGENANAPFNGSLIDAQGNKAHEKIAMVDFTEKGFDEIEIKIGGLDEYEDVNLYFCGFIIGGENVYYIENDAIKTQAETVTYNDVCAILIGTGNEEENENV